MSWIASPVDRPDIRNAIAYLRSEKARDLRVVFFGSSRMQSAVLPQEWARLAGMKPAAVVNLAVNSGRLWDARYMLRRGGPLAPSIELVVVEIATWDFNQNMRNPWCFEEAVPEHFRNWASFTDRVSADDPLMRVKLLGEWVWPLYQRRPFSQWMLDSPVVRPEPPPLPAILWDKQSRDSLAAHPAFRGASIATAHFAGAEMSDFTERNLDAFIHAATGEGRRVVLVQLPAREEYVRTIQADPKAAMLYREVQDVVRARTAERHVSAVIWNVASDCGLTEDVFIDYGHFNREGATLFTDRLFEEIGAVDTTSTQNRPVGDVLR